MTLRTNSAEGQVSGTVPTSANSGGGSGDALDLVVKTGTTPVILFDSAQAAHGTRSYHITGASGDVAYLGYQGANDLTGAAHVYIRFNALPSANMDLLTIRAAAPIAKFGITSANKFDVSGASATLHTFPSVVSVGVWYRLELQVDPGTTTSNGQVNGAYYVADSTSAVDSPYVSSATVDAGTANVARSDVGKITSAVTLNAWFDDFGFNNGTFTPIGPTTPAPTAAFTSSSSGLVATFNSSTSSAVSPATLTSYAWTFGDGGTSTSANPTHTYTSVNTFSVTLTVTDSNGQNDSVTNSITVTAPTSNGTISSVTVATGWTPSSGTALACLTDANQTTLITSSGNPSGLELDVVLQALTAPASGQPLLVILTADTLLATSAHVNAQLVEGATTRSSVTNVALLGGSGSSVTATVSLTFPWTDVQNVGSWSALKVLMQFSAS